MELRLFQRQVADQLGADEASVHNWETGKREPELRFLPSIHNWLGYCPVSPAPATLGDRVVRWREANGVSRQALCERLGIDPGTLGRIETGSPMKPTRRVLRALHALFAFESQR